MAQFRDSISIAKAWSNNMDRLVLWNQEIHVINLPVTPFTNVACVSNHMPYKVWDGITYPFPNFNGCTTLSNICDYLFMKWLMLNRVYKGGTGNR